MTNATDNGRERIGLIYADNHAKVDPSSTVEISSIAECRKTRGDVELLRDRCKHAEWKHWTPASAHGTTSGKHCIPKAQRSAPLAASGGRHTTARRHSHGEKYPPVMPGHG